MNATVDCIRPAEHVEHHRPHPDTDRLVCHFCHPPARELWRQAPAVELWVDGACQPNPGHGGWCAILRSGEHERVVSGEQPDTTNNRMEITAAIKGLRALKMACEVTVYSDSQVLCNPFLKGWATKKNADLWDQLRAAMQRHRVSWVLVKGHSGVELNERADQIAQELARG